MGTNVSPDGRFEWDEAKNVLNKENHGFFFVIISTGIGFLRAIAMLIYRPASRINETAQRETFIGGVWERAKAALFTVF